MTNRLTLSLAALLLVPTACDDSSKKNKGADADDDGTTGSVATTDTPQTTDPGDPDDPDEGTTGSTTGDAETGDAESSEGGEESTGEASDEQTFLVRVHNTTPNLRSDAFSMRNDGQVGPLVEVGQSYRIEFRAYPGSALTFATMSAATNDWFYAPTGSGIPLFEDGAPRSGDMTEQVRLYDLGTEEEDPSTIATLGGMDIGDPDDDPNVRTVTEDVSADLTATLESLGPDENGAYRFALELTREGDAILTPGITLVHNSETPLFTNGEPDRGFGLERIAEDGMPGELQAWFQETSRDGGPLRLSASLTPFSPGIAYVFPGDGPDPLFTQGEPALEGSGLEELAEDGSPDVMATFFEDQGLSYGVSDGPAGPGGTLEFTVTARPGDRLGFATMFVQSNDWFLAFNNDGVPLFDEDGTPRSGSADSVEAYLWDAGTEADEPVGFGANQALRQADANTGAPDEDDTVRRVSAIDDLQFGKGEIPSAPGVVALGDPRGGYNLLTIEIEPVE
jgi:hypothetical protein